VATFSLDAYLERIGWTGRVEPTLDTLTALTRAHISRIPFENLDVLLGRGVRIDLDSIHAKLVVARRGGFCFEHGTLCHAVLERIGFRVKTHAARVLTVLPKSEAARTHMILTVDVGGRVFLIDPGFGGHGALVPVPLVAGQDVRDGLDRHRVVRDDGEWVLEAEIGGRMTPLWTSSLEPLQTIDFLMANHFVCSFPDSPFVNRLMLRALTAGGRTSVMNRDVTVLRDGQSKHYQLADRAALRALLVEQFGFDLPEVEQLRVPMIQEWT